METIFERRTDNLTQQLKDNLQNYIDVLYSLEGFYASSNAITRKDFKNFVDYWIDRFPGIRTLAWNPRVKESERAFVEQTARADGFTNFEIRERAPDGQLVRAGRRAEYVPVLYLETRQGNRKALGFDAAVDPIRRHALDVARDTGKPVATDRTTLVRDLNNDPGFVVFLPVFKSGRFQSVEERRRNLRGYVSGAFRIHDIIDTLQATTGFIDINIRVSEQSDGLANPLPQGTNVQTAITNRAPIRQVSASSVTPYRTVSFQSAGRNWTLEFTPTKQYMLDQKIEGQTGIILLGGMLSTGLLSTFLLAVTGYIVKLNTANTDLKKEINERTAAQNEIRKYAVIVDSLDEAIIGSRWGGMIITWNQAAAKLYGYAEEEIIGHHISILFHRA
jgi:CHASE1-domain containing sensor protein